MQHEVHDKVGLEMGRRVAARLREQPALLQIARDNLDRWSRRNAGSASLLRCYREWSAILERPLEDICRILCADTEDARRLRQNSPFPACFHLLKSGPSRLASDSAMKKSELEHIIRAATGFVGANQFVIIGNQAALGQFPDSPAELLVSNNENLPKPFFES